MSSQPSEEVPPALPPRSTQRDSRGSSQISPIHSSHPTPPMQSEKAATEQPAHPAHPEQAAHTSQTAPAQAVNNFPTSTPAAPTETIKTKREELTAGDALWQWKVGLRFVTVLVGLIGIGCAAWIVSRFTAHTSEMGYDFYSLDDAWSLPWTLITFVLSVVWSTICIIVFFARRPNAPVHPGAQVGVDLILWLAFIFTGLFAILGTSSVADWGSNGRLSWYYSGSSDGQYAYAPGNDTWYWTSNQYSSYYGQDRDCNATGSYQSRYGSYRFPTCELQDAYINALWKGKGLRYNIDLTATVCQFISLVLHLTLFIWACVDTHRRRKTVVTKDAEKLAADIVMNMVKSGAIVPAPGQAHFRPIPGQQFAYPQQYSQQYPQQYTQQYQHQYAGQFAPQHIQPQQIPPPATPVNQPPTVASSSNEKGAGPRYA